MMLCKLVHMSTLLLKKCNYKRYATLSALAVVLTLSSLRSLRFDLRCADDP